MKAQIMTITMLLIFVMLLIELFAFTELSTGYNQIAGDNSSGNGYTIWPVFFAEYCCVVHQVKY